MLVVGARRGTRVALVPRDGGPVRWVEDEAFWMWHAANAYERPDGARRPRLRPVGRAGGMAPGERPGHGGFARAVIDPVAGTVPRAVLDDRASIEFPRIDDRRLGGRHGVVAVGDHRPGRQRPRPGRPRRPDLVRPRDRDERALGGRRSSPSASRASPPSPGDGTGRRLVGHVRHRTRDRSQLVARVLLPATRRRSRGTRAHAGAGPARPARGLAADRGVRRPRQRRTPRLHRAQPGRPCARQEITRRSHVEAVQHHHLVPGRDEVADELLLARRRSA